MRREWLEKDYYQVLGVERTASQKDIRRAYRALARTLHPDSNPDNAEAEARFKEVSEAYSTLGDPEQRREYDETRETFSRHAYAGGPGPGGARYVRMEDLGDLGDLFGAGGGMFGGLGDLFGGRTSRRGPQRGGDLEAEVSLTFHEAVSGASRPLTVDGPGGRRTVTVKIPAGVKDGARVRVRGKGRQGANGGPAGDLLVRVHVGSHPIFRRSGARDLKVDLPITFAEAALGASVTVPTLDGSVTLKVPPGTHSGTTLRARGKGVTTSGGTGDLLVTVVVEVPDRLTDEQRDLVERFAATQSDHHPRSHLGV